MTPCKSGISLYPWVRPRGAPLTQLCPLTGQVGTGVPGVTSEHPQELGHSSVADREAPGAETGARLRIRMLRVDTGSPGAAVLPCPGSCPPTGHRHRGCFGCETPLWCPQRGGDRLRGAQRGGSPVPPVPSAKPVQPCTQPRRREGMG